MTTEEKLVKVLQPLNIPVFPEPYKGNLEVFMTYIIESVSDGFADDNPTYLHDSITLSLHIPYKNQYSNIQKEIRHILNDADFTYPSTTQQLTNDNETRIIFFDFEYANFEEV